MSPVASEKIQIEKFISTRRITTYLGQKKNDTKNIKDWLTTLTWLSKLYLFLWYVGFHDVMMSFQIKCTRMTLKASWHFSISLTVFGSMD